MEKLSVVLPSWDLDPPSFSKLSRVWRCQKALCNPRFILPPHWGVSEDTEAQRKAEASEGHTAKS